MVEIIIDSLAEGTGHSRSCGHCAGVSTSSGRGRMLKEVQETVGVQRETVDCRLRSASLMLVKLPMMFYSCDGH